MFSASKLLRTFVMAFFIMSFTAISAFASSGDAGSLDIQKILLALLVIMISAKIGGEIFARLNQPAVLGELIFGIIIGNLSLVGYDGLSFLHTELSVVNSINLFAEIGVILLLFQVGLESNLSKMMEYGASSLIVATLGVVTPFLLGWGVAVLFLPGESIYVHMFIGAALCATSLGIVARIFMDLGCIQTPEARIIIGAGVIDDIQGLVILAAITGAVEAVNAGTQMAASGIIIIVVKALAFLLGALFIGRWLSKKTFRLAVYMKSQDLILVISLIFCFLFSYLSILFGLAPIVGAFAAGLILEEVHWRALRMIRGETSVEALIKPIAAVFVPVFFVSMGMQVNLASFADTKVLLFAGVLTIAAILGKQACSLGVLEKGLNRLSVGLGMIPRGELGLIFASVGSKLVIDGVPVVGRETYSAIVIMVVITTMITPPLLKAALMRSHPMKNVTAPQIQVDDDNDDDNN